MRRVYYAYAIRVITTPGVLRGFFMLAVLIGLTYFVSIGDVIQNMEIVGFSGLGQLAYNAVTNTEAWTLLLLGVFIYTALSFRFSFTARSAEPVFAKI